MKITFNNLEPGDIIYGVYDKKHNADDRIVSEYELVEIPIKENYRETQQRYNHDYWGEVISSYIETKDYITFEFLGCRYHRDYSDTYKMHMPISPGLDQAGPWLEIFVNKEDAINYIIKHCTHIIEQNNKTIEKCNKENYILNETIKKYER